MNFGEWCDICFRWEGSQVFLLLSMTIITNNFHERNPCPRLDVQNPAYQTQKLACRGGPVGRFAPVVKEDYWQ